jgi:hypothetical protein
MQCSMLASNIYIGIFAYSDYKPFKDVVLNTIFVFIELAVSTCFTTVGILVNADVDQEVLIWIILVCMYFSYLLHSVMGYYRLIKFCYYPKIKDFLYKNTSQQTRNVTAMTKDVIS